VVFHSRPEAYTYAIWLLSKFEQRYPELKAIPACIERVRVAFENHEQNVSGVCDFIRKANLPLNDGDTGLLNTLIADISNRKFEQNSKQKFENPLGRRAESELAIQWLLNPTPKMMEAVGRVSQEILKVITDLEKNDPDKLLDELLDSLDISEGPITCGGFQGVPNVARVKTVLQDNKRDMLAKIMHIHYKFAAKTVRQAPIQHGVEREPVGKLAEIIREIWKNRPLASFFKEGINQDNDKGITYRSYIANVKMYDSPLYTAERGRGRFGPLKNKQSTQLGLMLTPVKDLEYLLSAWNPDCKCQDANLQSNYVLDLIENDTVYVSGPSGMTSLLLGQMEILANFENLELKQHYLAAVAGYVVGGGFHSLHEVIGPAQYALELVPGYSVVVPNPKDKAPPPNYNLFFAQQAAIDPEFNVRRELAWKRHLNSFEKNYAPKFLEGFQKTVEILDKSVENKFAGSSSGMRIP
jgi:hypothetical protein